MMDKGEKIMTVLLVLAMMFVLYTELHAYTIVDTVYVAPTPDSITVTMSWEEWEEYQAWFAPDSGASIDWDSLADVPWDVPLMDTIINYDIEAGE